MQHVEGVRFFDSYPEAERFADEWAGDCEARVAVVEDFDVPGVFQVMDLDLAETVLEHADTDCEIQYTAGVNQIDS